MLYVSSLLVFLISSVSLSKEGFHHSRESLPGPVQAVWEATFNVAPKSSGVSGSAFIIKKFPGNSFGKAILYFLTNAHIIVPNCGSQLGPCPAIRLTSSLAFDSGSDKFIQVDTNERTFENVSVEKISTTNDLAIISVEIDNYQHFSLQPVFIESNCNTVTVNLPVYFIGYPSTEIRASIPGVPPSNKSYRLRRWSVGKVLSRNSQTNNGVLTLTTADSLPGNSGGPVVTADGRVVGVAIGSVGPKNDQRPYLGGQDTNPFGAFETCEAVNAFRKL